MPSSDQILIKIKLRYSCGISIDAECNAEKIIPDGWLNMLRTQWQDACLDRIISEPDGVVNGVHDALMAPAPRHALKALWPQRVHTNVQHIQACIRPIRLSHRRISYMRFR